MIDVGAATKAIQANASGIKFRARGFFTARWMLWYLTFMLPKLERLPRGLRWLQMSDEKAERRLKWAMGRLWIEADAGDGRWTPVATGWDHIRQAI